MNLIIGIDPGAHGAAAFFHNQALTWIVSFDKDPDWRALLFSYCKFLQPDYAVLEEVHAWRRDGKKSAFSFGRRRGEVETVLHLAKCPVQLIQPQEWQRRLGLLRKDKAYSKKLALELFPQLTGIKGDVFDAVLIGWAQLINR
jgi:hypothetical protein